MGTKFNFCFNIKNITSLFCLRVILGILLLYTCKGAATVEERKLGCNLLWEYKCLERDDNNNTICIPWTKVKDGVSDCPNGTDEVCESDEFNCGQPDPFCIDLELVYDGHVDCANGIDEGCPEGAFICKDNTSCIPSHQYKDGVPHCSDGSDEECTSDEFKCVQGGKCIPRIKFQDGIPDCDDGSDEDCLPSQHRCLCGFPRCLDAKFVNDGIPDCLEGSDEGHVEKSTIVCPDESLQGLIAVDRKRRTSDTQSVDAVDSSVTTVASESDLTEEPTSSSVPDDSAATTTAPLEEQTGDKEVKSEVASGFTADKDTEKQREGKLNDEFSTSERGLSEDSTRDSIELVTEKGTTTTESLLETDAPTTEKYIRSSEPSSPLSAKKSTKHTYELTPSFSGTSSGFHGSIKPTRSGSTSRARTPNIPHSSGRGAASGSKTTSREPSTRPSFISSLTDDFFSYATKTFYTTFTYFTTYLVDDSTSVTSSTEVISNVVSEKITNVPKTILRTTPESFAALKTRRGPVTRTYYTTFTYFTTFLQGTETSVTSSLETITNIVTESPVDSKSKDYLHIKPTTSSDKEIEITRAPTLDTTNDSPISTSVIDDSTLQSSPNLIEKTNSISVTPTTSKVKNLRTFYTTYTYLTTYLEGTETSISSSIEIITSVATETLDIKPTGVLEASSTNKFNTAQTLNEKNGDSSTSEINATPTVGEVSPTPSESETRLKKSTTAANDKETTEVSPPSSSVIFFPDPIKSFNDSAEDSGSNFTIIAEESAHEDSMAITVDSVFNNTDNFTTTTTAVPPKPSNSSKPGFNIGPVLSGIAGLFINGGLAMVGAGTGGGAADIPVLSNRNDTNDRIHPPPNAPGFMERPPPQATVSGIQEPNFIPVGGFGASRNQQQDPINIAPSSTTLTSGFTKIEGPLLKMPHPGIVIDMQHELPADMSRAPITEIHPSIEPLINNGFRPGTTERGFTPIISQTDKIKRSSTHHFSSSASIEVDKSSGTSTKKMEDSRTTVSSLGVTTVTSVLQGHSTIFFNRNRPHRNTFSTIPTVSLLGSDSDEIGFTRYPSVSTIINGDRTTFSTIWIQVANTLVGDDRADTQQSVIQEHGGDYTSEVHGGNTRFIQPSTTTYYTTHTYFTTTYVNGNPVISTREETSSEVIILRPVDIQPTTVHGDTTRQTLTIETLAHNEKTVDPGILSTSTLTLQHGSVEGSENRREDTSDKVHHSTTNLRHKFIIDTAGDPLFGTLDEVTIRASTSFPDGDGVTQTTLSTDDSLSDHLSGGQIPSAVQQVVQQDEQTHFTVAHYYTEMKDHTSSIILDRQETSTDIVTLAPTTILHFHPQPVTRTYFTTYSYYTTSLLGDRTVINSRAETSTRIVTLGPFTESAIVPTATEAAIKEATAVPLEITTTVYDSGHVKPEIQDVNPSLATYYTRYTYFTTYLRAGTQSVTSNIVTYTQIVPQITRTVFLGDGGYAEYGGHIAIKPTRITGRVPGIVTRLPDGEVTAYGVLDGSRTVLYVNNGATRTLLSTRLGAGAAATTQFQHIGGDGNYGSGKIKGTQIVAGTATRKVISVITTTVTETINGGTSTVVRYITPTITTVATVTETLKPILSEVTSTETVTVVGVTDQKGKVETSIIQGSLGGHGLEGGVVHVGVSGTDKETPPLRTEYITRLEATPQTVLGTRTSVIFKGGIPETKMFPFTSTLPLRTLFLTIIGGQRTVTRYVTPTTVITTTDVTQQVGVEPSIDTKTYTGTRPFTILVDGNTHQTGSGGHTDITIGTKPIYTSLPTINVGETIMVDGGTTIDDGQHSGRTTEKSPIGIVNIEPPRTSSPPKGVTGGLIIEPPEGRTECNLYCNANKKEVCRFFRGKNRCGCRAGEARIDNSKQCEPVKSYELLLNLISNGGKEMVYTDSYRAYQSKEYQDLVAKCNLGLRRAYRNTKVAQAFRGSEVLGFDDARLTNSEWKGVITRVVVHVRQNDTADQYLIREELAKSMLASNNSLGGTDLIGYPVKERLRAQDFNECNDADFNDCDPKAKCINLNGTFTCLCYETLNDTNPARPGRICSPQAKESSAAVCSYCNYQGECITDDSGEIACQCYPWHFGPQCQINGLALAIILPLLLGLLLLLLLIWCCCCRKGGCCGMGPCCRGAACCQPGGCCGCCAKPAGKRHSTVAASTSGAGGVFPRIGGSIDEGTGTLDKKAMITEDSASDSSGEQSRFAHIADAFGARATDTQRSKKSAKMSGLGYEDRSLSGFADVPPVLIPRAKHKHPKQYISSSAENILQRSGGGEMSTESKLIDILEGEAQHARSMGHGKESSAFATIPSTKSRSQAHSHAHSGAHAHAHSSSNVRSSSVDRSDLRHYQKRSTLAAGGSSSAMSEQREGGTFSERHVRGSSSNINASSQGYDQSANEQSSFAGVHSGSKLSKSKQGSSQNVSHASTVHEENIASSRSYAMNNAGRSGSHEKGHSTQAGQGGSGMMRSIADERDAAGGESSSYYHREVKEYDANDILEAIREVGAEKRYRKERELQGIAAREGRYHGSRTMESERGYRAEMIVEPEEYSKTMASGSSIDLEPDFDASSSRYDSNSYGRYGARTVSEVRSCDETTIHPATRHLGADSYYSSSKGRSSRYARTEEDLDITDADENVTDVSVSTMMVPNAQIYYKEDSGDYSESSEQSFPSQVRRDRRRDRDLYDGGPSENTYQQSYYSYEKSESKTSYMDKRS